jgi:hypothetical protein
VTAPEREAVVDGIRMRSDVVAGAIGEVVDAAATRAVA